MDDSESLHFSLSCISLVPPWMLLLLRKCPHQCVWWRRNRRGREKLWIGEWMRENERERARGEFMEDKREREEEQPNFKNFQILNYEIEFHEIHINRGR